MQLPNPEDLTTQWINFNVVKFLKSQPEYCEKPDCDHVTAEEHNLTERGVGERTGLSTLGEAVSWQENLQKEQLYVITCLQSNTLFLMQIQANNPEEALFSTCLIQDTNSRQHLYRIYIRAEPFI
jgi:hypothetical protein